MGFGYTNIPAATGYTGEAHYTITVSVKELAALKIVYFPMVCAQKRL